MGRERLKGRGERAGEGRAGGERLRERVGARAVGTAKDSSGIRSSGDTATGRGGWRWRARAVGEGTG